MNVRENVQFALMCIQELDHRAETPLLPLEISRLQGVPLEDCLAILKRLHVAGVVRSSPEGRFALVRPAGELTALEVLQALWTPLEEKPIFRMMVGGSRGVRVRKTLEAVRKLQDREGCSDVNE